MVLLDHSRPSLPTPAYSVCRWFRMMADRHSQRSSERFRRSLGDGLSPVVHREVERSDALLVVDPLMLAVSAMSVGGIDLNDASSQDDFVPLRASDEAPTGITIDDVHASLLLAVRADKVFAAHAGMASLHALWSNVLLKSSNSSLSSKPRSLFLFTGVMTKTHDRAKFLRSSAR